MVSPQVLPSDSSLTKATTGTLQLSASSITTAILGVGTSATHETSIGAGFDAVGSIVSFIIIC